MSWTFIKSPRSFYALRGISYIDSSYTLFAYHSYSYYLIINRANEALILCRGYGRSFTCQWTVDFQPSKTTSDSSRGQVSIFQYTLVCGK